MENLPDIIKGKKFLFIAGGLVVLLLVLMIFANSSRTKSNQEAVDQQGQPFDQQPQDIGFNDSPETQSPEVQQAIQEQMQADQEYSNWQENNEIDYPWLKILPLTSEKYFVYFDISRKTFVGRLYVNPEDNQEEIKNSILGKLKNEEDVPVDNFKFEWQVNP